MNKNSELPLVVMDAIWPKKGWFWAFALVIVGSQLIAFLAQLEIPLLPVPITGQTFGVLLIGAVLGSRLGTITVLTYIASGALGLPVFASGGSGVATLAGPTAGYLLGFVFAAFLVGWLSEWGWDRRVLTTAAAMLFGTLIIYVPGVIWLSRFAGWDNVFALGIAPFLFGDLLKVVLAAIALPFGWKLIGRQPK
jgi:biotin transport system substrate-specific component